MLQQTPVVRVLGPWAEWLRRWPGAAELAAASPAEVLRAWGKLGYPRRALRLQECAVAVTDRFGGELPRDVETLLTLPGIGDYTARAVACFAYGQAVPVVDTNVRRVIARAVHGRADQGAPSRRDLSDAATLLPPARARAVTFSAAIMELGALVCTSRAPRCPECPVRAQCAWQLAGAPAPGADAPRRRVQQFAGTDRQVRGRILDVLRAADGPVPRARIDAAWPDATQRDRCMVSLLSDGLIEASGSDGYALPGEGR